jgi:glycosyltransferase involved in cell wall biosynthesis
MSWPAISVIVPVYNTAGLLPRCIESLLEQTLREIELIFVNDASTDNSLDILWQYEKAHPDRIRVIHSETNLRQGGARNLGIAVARGTYIGFVDSDDWVEKQMYELLYKEAGKSDSDICYCYRYQVQEEGLVKKEDDATYFLPEGEITQATRKEMLLRHITFVQRYIYKRSLFMENQVLFPLHLRYEDLVIDPLLLLYARHIAAVKLPLYNYFIRKGSTTTAVNDEKYRDKMQVCEIIVNEYKKRGAYEAYRQEINYLFFRKGYIHSSLNYLLNAKYPDKAVIKKIRQSLLRVDEHYRQNPYYKSRVSFRFIDRMLSWNSVPALKMLKLFLTTIKYNV